MSKKKKNVLFKDRCCQIPWGNLDTLRRRVPDEARLTKRCFNWFDQEKKNLRDQNPTFPRRTWPLLFRQLQVSYNRCSLRLKISGSHWSKNIWIILSPALPRGCIFSKNENGKKKTLVCRSIGISCPWGFWGLDDSTHCWKLPPSMQKASSVQLVFKAVKT